MKKGKIYIITNDINDKVYIGQTIQPLNARLNQHVCKSRKRNQKISEAIRKYGREHFKIQPLLEDVEQKDLKRIEEEYIKKYDSVEKGYNIVYRDNICRSEKNFSVEMIVNDYRNGITIKKIAKKYKMCPKTVSKTLKQQNVAIRDWNKEQSVPLTKEMLEHKYIVENQSINQIAREVGLSGTAIRNWLVKFDLIKRHA